MNWKDRYDSAKAGSLKGAYVWWAAWAFTPYLFVVFLLALMTDWPESDVFLLGIPRLFKASDSDDDESDEADRPSERRIRRLQNYRSQRRSRAS